MINPESDPYTSIDAFYDDLNEYAHDRFELMRRLCRRVLASYDAERIGAGDIANAITLANDDFTALGMFVTRLQSLRGRPAPEPIVPPVIPPVLQPAQPPREDTPGADVARQVFAQDPFERRG